MDVAAQAGIEEQIPAWMMVVVVDVDLVAIPLPIAAAVEIVGSHDPVGAIVENHVAGTVVDRAGDEHFFNVLVVAPRVVPVGDDAVMLVIPVAIILAGFLLFPAFVLAVVMAVVIAFVLFPAFVLSIVVMLVAVAMLVAILGGGGQCHGAGQRAQRGAPNQLLHRASLCMRALPTSDQGP